MTATTRHPVDDLSARETARLMDSPLRRRILSVLVGVDRAEFSLVRDTVEVSGSVLSRQVAILAHAGYVTTSRATIARRRGVWLSLTPRGSRAMQDHLAATRRRPVAAVAPGGPSVVASGQRAACSSPAT